MSRGSDRRRRPGAPGGRHAELGSHELRQLLREVPVPVDPRAEQRGLEVVLAAYAAREAQPARPLPRLALALALAALLAALLLSPAGAAVRDWVGDVVATSAPPASHGLNRIPGGGRLLVQSAAGPWVVQPDGSRRLLGDYDEAAWSPHGLYVAAASGHELTAVEPDGTPHWTLSAPGTVRGPRWSPSGYLIAYRAGRALRLVAGDGSEDRLLAPRAAAVAPAWNPLGVPQLAYVAAAGGLRVADAFHGPPAKVRGRALAGIRQLEWGDRGAALLEVSPAALRLRGVAIQKLAARTRVGPGRELPLPEAATVRDAALAPRGPAVAAILGDRRAGPRGGSSVVLWDGAGAPARTLLKIPGRLSELAFSPDGRRLLVAWPEADEWLFLLLTPGRRDDFGTPGREIVPSTAAVGEVGAAFAPGQRRGSFPRVEGWCCRAGLRGAG